MKIVSVGEVLWDVFGKEEFLGGAPLNFSATAQRLGHPATLLTAVGADARGYSALRQMDALGLTTEFAQTVPDLATGTAIVVTDSTGSATYVIDRPAAFDRIHFDDALLTRVTNLQPDWIYFGTLAQTDPRTEQMLSRLVQSSIVARFFYDMNLREGHWNLPLVQRLSSIATVLKLNDSEAEVLSELTLGSGPFHLEDFCRHWASTYGVETICVTLGSKGCAVFAQDRLQTFEGVSVKVVDTVGAGDAFAAGFLHGLHLGWPILRTAAFANALGALLASRAGATPPWTVDECLQLMPVG